jgi:plastocyanin
MRLKLLIGAVGVAVGIALAVMAPYRAKHDQGPHRYVVEVRDFFFDPPGLLIQPKDTIVWVFREITVDGHTVTAYHPENFRHELRIPEAAQPFHSGIRDKVGDTFALAFDAVGVYDYFCLPHEFFGMVGRLIVKEPVGPGTKPVSVGLPEAAQKVIPSLDEIVGPVGLLFRLSARVNTLVFDYEHSQREQALSSLEELLEDLRAGAELFEVLTRVQLLTDVQKKLEELRELLRSGAAMSEVFRVSQELKALLAEARKRLQSP